MKNLTLAGLVGISTTLILTGVVALDCGGSGGDWGSNAATVRPPKTDPDAGTDAAFLCSGLDQTKPVVLYLSADDSNSMASPVLARELLEAGQAPSLESIRTYEFLNYY